MLLISFFISLFGGGREPNLNNELGSLSEFEQDTSGLKAKFHICLYIYIAEGLVRQHSLRKWGLVSLTVSTIFLQSFLKFFLAVAFISRHAGIFLSLYIGSLENINKVLVCIGFMLLGCAQSTLCGERAISATQKRPVP